jgi:hypothetical protein
MARVYGVHLIALRPGVPAAEFERFVREEVNSCPWPEGIRISLLKGDRGDRAGKYLVLFQFDSVERRDWASPAVGGLAAEYLQMIEPQLAAMEKWATLASGPVDPTFTDYVVVSE